MYDDALLSMYDLGGGSRFRSVWKRFYAELWGMIWVVDSTDPARFDESEGAFREAVGHEMMVGKPCVVLANKIDRESDSVPLTGFSGEKIFRVSATDPKRRRAVMDALGDLMKRILAAEETLMVKIAKDVKKQGEIEDQEREARRVRVEAWRKQQDDAERAEAKSEGSLPA
jgi:signal recognition particle receptor subunit beta